MSKTVGDFFVERLYEWGVRTIFGYPGDGINGVLGALDRAGGKIRFIQVRHEEMGAFMASAHAKFTGEPGVCLSTGGPGAAHLVTGLYDAKCDHVPVLAICGQAPRRSPDPNFAIAVLAAAEEPSDSWESSFCRSATTTCVAGSFFSISSRSACSRASAALSFVERRRISFADRCRDCVAAASRR